LIKLPKWIFGLIERFNEWRYPRIIKKGGRLFARDKLKPWKEPWNTGRLVGGPE